MPNFRPYPSIKARRDFSRTYRQGQIVRGRNFVMHYRQRPDKDAPRIGYAVSRKIRSAVRRNRLKRLTKEAVRLSGLTIRSGLDIIFLAKESAAQPDFHSIRQEIHDMIVRAKLVIEE